ncbi:MAG: Fe-S oxidoreductase [Deltaproteobacteria bacterium RIFOXYD12_FULL_50_9]|nr:MAG: Fe-S oxidoreductase [Deltaproteobacteria bacterium RIFOXYD12_FULL_50_9]
MPGKGSKKVEEKIFQCRFCGACCQGQTTVSLDENDIKRLVAFFGKPYPEILEKYLRVTGNVIQMKIKDGHCIFFNDGCTIHPCKPWRCRQWPLHPSLLADRVNFQTISSSCPGLASNIEYEEFCRYLKQILNKSGANR